MSKRPNGAGNVYRRKSGTWTARVVDHYKLGEDNVLRPVWKTKGGFRTKKDALLYLPTLISQKKNEHPPQELKKLFEMWKESYKNRVSAKTIEGYSHAFQHFSDYHYKKIDTISTTDLQNCIDKCQKGKRTKQLMKVIANLLCKFAMDDNQISRNPAANLYVGDDETTHYEPLTEEELEKIEKSGLEYADYVVALCYLGHRPAEFFALRKADYHEENGICYLIGGAKTAAGRGRAVTIPPKVLPIIKRRLAVPGTDLLFPRADRRTNGELAGTYSAMPVRYFNHLVWHPMMQKLRIEGKVPYATRHTYANKIKRVEGDEKDKARLMGHAQYSTTQEHYQTTNLEERNAITSQLG